MTPLPSYWYGHEPIPSGGSRPEPMPTPRSVDASWAELVALMKGAPGDGLSISGTVTARLYPEDMGGYGDAPEPKLGASGQPGSPADLPVSGPLWKVWRSGTRVRIDDEGHARYRCDGVTTWFFDIDLGEWTTMPGVQSILWVPPGAALLHPMNLSLAEVMTTPTRRVRRCPSDISAVTSGALSWRPHRKADTADIVCRPAHGSRPAGRRCRR